MLSRRDRVGVLEVEGLVGDYLVLGGYLLKGLGGIRGSVSGMLGRPNLWICRKAFSLIHYDETADLQSC